MKADVKALWKQVTEKSISFPQTSRSDPEYQQKLSLFPGLHTFPREKIDEIFHNKMETSCYNLIECFQHDVVKLGESNQIVRWSFIGVQRIVVGETGLSYKYLGLRLFCHPWNKEDLTGHTEQEINAFTAFKELNQKLSAFGESTQDRHQHKNEMNFNLSLVNYMNLDASSVFIRDEPYYGMGKLVVGWHKDKPLQDNSAVAVYHVFQDDGKSYWGLGLKKAWEVDTPPLLIELENKSSYFMMSDCNESTRHCIISKDGSSNRFSSTHRLGQTEADTFDYIEQRAKKALALSKDWTKFLNKNEMKEITENGKDAALFKETNQKGESLDCFPLEEIFQIESEIEFEWIRQFWIQGEKHSQHQHWWLPKINQLELYWNDIVTCEDTIFEQIISNQFLEKNYYLGLIQNQLKEKLKLIDEWNSRYSATPFSSLPKEKKPVRKPKILKSKIKKQIQKISNILNEIEVRNKRNIEESENEQTTKRRKIQQFSDPD